ncbi:MAG: HAMP domain-containing sensor histidine kinase [Planctomycetota bacterium]
MPDEDRPEDAKRPVADPEGPRWSDPLEAVLPERLSRLAGGGISLADKCLILFGGAVVLIVFVAMAVPWLRMNALVGAGQLELSRELVASWRMNEPDSDPEAPSRVRRLGADAARGLAENDRFLRRAIERLDDGRRDFQRASWDGGARIYRYATADRGPEGELLAVVMLERRSNGAAAQLIVNSVYLISAGTLVLGLAVLVFYFVVHRLVLSPVHRLKQTAERVRSGRLETRSDIRTGDEFEELAETFNLMLADMEQSHGQLRTINSALDLKLNELAEANLTLYESARMKGDFLAKVSHELRTPLNSIIGFAELLDDIAKSESHGPEDEPAAASRSAALGRTAEKRRRYLSNILSAGRQLLELIETLLEMAKIDAGRIDVRPERMVVGDVCEGLAGLIQPLADRKGVRVAIEIQHGLPVIETDVRKFQQVVFNFLSNAVKFTGPAQPGGGHVTLRAELLAGPEERVRVSVIDDGPGIASEDQARVFERFEQAEAGYTRGTEGTGLGLPICRELAGLLQGEIQLVSELGRGSMFSLIVPLALDRERTEEMKLEARFRGTLAGRRTWTSSAS